MSAASSIVRAAEVGLETSGVLGDIGPASRTSATACVFLLGGPVTASEKCSELDMLSPNVSASAALSLRTRGSARCHLRNLRRNATPWSRP